jgi:hypothetical protein
MAHGVVDLHASFNLNRDHGSVAADPFAVQE